MPQASREMLPPNLAQHRLEDALSAARRGHGGVVIVRGGIGSGKSVLIANTISRPTAATTAADGASLAGLLQMALSDALGAAPIELGHAVAAIRWTLGLPADRATSRAPDGLDLAPALATVLPTLGPEPVVIVLDGVDMAQPAAQRILGHLSVALASSPCLLVAAGLATGMGNHGIGPTVASATTIDIGPLDRQGVTMVLSDQLGRNETTAEVERVLECTGAVARFVSDAAASLVDGGHSACPQQQSSVSHAASMPRILAAANWPRNSPSSVPWLRTASGSSRRRLACPEPRSSGQLQRSSMSSS